MCGYGWAERCATEKSGCASKTLFLTEEQQAIKPLFDLKRYFG